MGTNPAPHLADLTCYAHEARLIDYLLTTDNINTARAFVGTFRYIDDILSADNPSFEKYVKLVGDNGECVRQMYPDYLSLNKTTNAPESVDYLGLNISNTPRAFLMNVADNKQCLPVPKINYPNLRGNFPECSGYGVFIGQLHRFARICTSSVDFCERATNLYDILLTKKGFLRPKLIRAFKGFVRDHNPYKTPAPAITQRFTSKL